MPEAARAVPVPSFAGLRPFDGPTRKQHRQNRNNVGEKNTDTRFSSRDISRVLRTRARELCPPSHRVKAEKHPLADHAEGRT